MICTHPLCRKQSEFIPVVELPTIWDADPEKKMDPTYLLFNEVCQEHMIRYGFEHCGISAGDWAAIRDAAHERGYSVPAPEVVVFQFKPRGWVPYHSMPMERD